MIPGIKDKVWLASGCEEGIVAIHCISDVDIDAVKGM
jgi:hypothetical protein